MLKKHIFPKIIFLVMVILFISNGFILATGLEVLQNDKLTFKSLMIAHGTTGSSWHPFAEGIAEIIRKEIPGSNITVIPGNSDPNLAMLKRGEIDLAISTTDSANTAISGWEGFPEPISLNEVNSIARLYDAKIQFVVLDNVGINSIEEIKAKSLPLKISVCLRGTGMEIGARRILGEYGMTFEDIEKWGGRVVYYSQSESIRMMGDGQINAYVALSAVPLVNLTELALKRDFKILPIRDDIIEKLVNLYNYTPGIIPAGTYKGLREDISTICVTNGLFASGSINEQTAYLITKSLLNNIEMLRRIHSQISQITPEFMNKKMVFPVHPGAQRAYEEYIK